MTSDAIADLVVAVLNATTDAPVSFTALKPASTAAAQIEQPDGYAVFVIPYDESETAFDQGNACRRERVVSLVVNGPIAGQVDRAKALELAEFVRISLEDGEFSGYRWTKNETVTLYDADALKKKHFLSLARATYYTLN